MAVITKATIFSNTFNVTASEGIVKTSKKKCQKSIQMTSYTSVNEKCFLHIWH